MPGGPRPPPPRRRWSPRVLRRAQRGAAESRRWLSRHRSKRRSMSSCTVRRGRSASSLEPTRGSASSSPWRARPAHERRPGAIHGQPGGAPARPRRRASDNRRGGGVRAPPGASASALSERIPPPLRGGQNADIAPLPVGLVAERGAQRPVVKRKRWLAEAGARCRAAPGPGERARDEPRFDRVIG